MPELTSTVPEIRFDAVANQRALDGKAPPPVRPPAGPGRWILRLIALVYLVFLLVIPVGLIFWRTLQNGVAPVWKALTSPAAIHAFEITLIVAGCAVVLNTIFGMIVSFLLVRHEFRGKAVLDKLVDLPLAVSPVVVGLALILVYGRQTTLGSWFGGHGIDIIYALPGMVMATAFVSLPLMVREVAPILEEIGTEQEQAAATLGASSAGSISGPARPARPRSGCTGRAASSGRGSRCR